LSSHAAPLLGVLKKLLRSHGQLNHLIEINEHDYYLVEFLKQASLSIHQNLTTVDYI